MTERKPDRIFRWLLAAAVAFLFGTIVHTRLGGERSAIDPENPQQVARGREIYRLHCAACHGAKLEGQANWRERLPNGRMPSPPHDESGHTWHHPDALLIGIIKEGLVPGRYAPPNYQSDMPAFGGVLRDEEIQAVLAYIKSTWPQRVLAYQADIDERSRQKP